MGPNKHRKGKQSHNSINFLGYSQICPIQALSWRIITSISKAWRAIRPPADQDCQATAPYLKPHREIIKIPKQMSNSSIISVAPCHWRKSLPLPLQGQGQQWHVALHRLPPPVSPGLPQCAVYQCAEQMSQQPCLSSSVLASYCPPLLPCQLSSILTKKKKTFPCSCHIAHLTFNPQTLIERIKESAA